ncbi:AarF/UbiB family protein [Alphaproteobacteria bacterium]|nr:AarF/UbiB family protein [Alphaproteobacteria bacterium]
MLIKEKLKCPIWKIPYFLIFSCIVFVKLAHTGIFKLLLDSSIFSNKLNVIFKFINFIFHRNDKKHVGYKLLNCLIVLGPGFIKFGQALSTRPDLLGEETCDHLQKLQDDIKPFSYSVAKKIIESEAQKSIEDIFTTFNKIPIATASVAQVHFGTLENGDEVAIKILKPNIEKLLFQDFIFFYWISKCFELFIPKVKRLKLSKNVEILSETSLNEIDLTMEASAADELAENFKDHLQYRVPKIYWELTNKKMLVLEYIEGIKINNLSKLQREKHNVDRITEIGTEVFFLQVFRDGFFHGDMHPGNIFIDKKGRLVPIDFGIMGRLSNNDRHFLALLLTYLLNKNFKKVVEIHSEANMLGKDISHDHLAQAIRAISTPILNKPIGQISLAKLLGQILGLSKEFNIEVQPQFTLLQKTMLMAEGTTRQINPEINMWDLSGPLIDKWINESHDPFKIFEDWIHKNKILLLKIPEIMDKIDKMVSKKMN